jgi:hypothetical protein
MFESKSGSQDFLSEGTAEVFPYVVAALRMNASKETKNALGAAL